MSILECPFHKYFIIPLVDVFTLGIYGGICNMTRIEKRLQQNLSKVKDGSN